MVEEMIRRVPMKRLGTARDIANTMTFLASDEAAYITGQAISVSGGLVMN
jgi:3-oxoacyl-[acyl-carrier protein] reductase